MFDRFFRKKPARAAGEALYAAAADQARDPKFYTEMGAPDTVEGRFEMTVLHVWLVMRKLKGADSPARDAAQSLLDTMFSSFDDALRELGVGDLVVGKKIRKMAENFYGRAQAYEEAMAGEGGNGQPLLAAALARNIHESNDPETALGLADYVISTAAAIDAQSSEDILRGEVSFSGGQP